jgi:hypothetical protein
MSPGSILPPGDVLPISKQQIVVVDESSNVTHMAPPTVSPVTGTPSTWKQGQLPHSTSASLGSKSSGGGGGSSSSKSDVSNQAVSDEKIGLNKLEIEPSVVDFVPRVSAADVKISPTPVVALKDTESTPVVSAQTNAPTVEVVRSNREQFPALKPSAPVHQSPRRKQSQRPEAASSVPQATTVASNPVQSTLPPALATSRETTPTADTKVSKKPTPTEESAPPSSAFPVSQSPKEKRDQDKSHGREREKSSSISQGRGEREKSASSSSSQHHGRDREKSSHDKDKASTASQGGPKDRDKSSTKEATPVPSPIAPVVPSVSAAQPQPEQPPPARPTPTAEDTKQQQQQQQTNGEMTAVDTAEGEYKLMCYLYVERVWKQYVMFNNPHVVCISNSSAHSTMSCISTPYIIL